ncbi:MAG: FAD-dependent oxidoreductase [Gammaproteobacteria bacterium]|nr:FAD-dependent oxidoreductase [Gammaproteobacteria bacterium]MXW45854.1 NAD(P)-binding protein [Gammaproteobacteria bacterium]MYD00722.1 NAD(P)-binding protein [Gammaproteobacteria bacterium]MYI25490.1 NAD(P)-binding protein [Gammaproteobacteria bacterium]
MTKSAASPRLAPDRLERLFDDAKPAYSYAEARIEAERCLNCHDAPCVRHCPTEIDIPKFIGQIASGNTRGAATTIFEQNMLGASCARVCPVEEMCVGACVYQGFNGQPIAIGRLQRHATDEACADERATGRRLFTPAAPIGRKVALIGGGPASLACAAHLALAGVQADIYERDSVPGGLNTTGVAPYKMKCESSLDEAAWLLSHGAHLMTGVAVGTDISFALLLDEYDAVFIGVGLAEVRTLEMDGPGVWTATDLIRAIKTEQGFALPPSVRRAVVIGGGNTAMDIARELAMLGVEKVTVAFRRREAEMSAYAHEWAGARSCGVVLRENLTPLAAVNRDGGLCAARFKETESGREIELACELLALAVGQEVGMQAMKAGVRQNANGTVWVDPATRRTSLSRVYAGGDCINGGREVVDAAADGRIAANAMLAEWSVEKGSG